MLLFCYVSCMLSSGDSSSNANTSSAFFSLTAVRIRVLGKLQQILSRRFFNDLTQANPTAKFPRYARWTACVASSHWEDKQKKKNKKSTCVSIYLAISLSSYISIYLYLYIAISQSIQLSNSNERVIRAAAPLNICRTNTVADVNSPELVWLQLGAHFAPL